MFPDPTNTVEAPEIAVDEDAIFDDLLDSGLEVIGEEPKDEGKTDETADLEPSDPTDEQLAAETEEGGDKNSLIDMPEFLDKLENAEEIKTALTSLPPEQQASVVGMMNEREAQLLAQEGKVAELTTTTEGLTADMTLHKQQWDKLLETVKTKNAPEFQKIVEETRDLIFKSRSDHVSKVVNEAIQANLQMVLIPDLKRQGFNVSELTKQHPRIIRGIALELAMSPTPEDRKAVLNEFRPSLKNLIPKGKLAPAGKGKQKVGEKVEKAASLSDIDLDFSNLDMLTELNKDSKRRL